ncbi:hypothetical protein [Actinoplanes couchii]|uniref:Uncharacterized protein n=1 Tax=Actinoplanes couchii TaxID=403638 RepID=A0ABQ3XFJ7_9ACTN|nr:hypothetical protein [Actinoplanes couchii]MDR6321785.1 hypothetical protein [Actinoplanes couchii]GID57257.1 hypothetical protein Aco03nite_056610 [Actinoplanes couchii]
MEVDEAAKALAEMQRRTEQTLRQGSPRRIPAWHTWGSAAGLTLVFASGDFSGWAAIALIVAGVAVTVGLTILLDRVTGVRLRMRALRAWPMVLVIGAILVAAIVVGSVMRLYDVPFDSTIGGLAGALVGVVGLGRAQAAAARPRAES